MLICLRLSFLYFPTCFHPFNTSSHVCYQKKWKFLEQHDITKLGYLGRKGGITWLPIYPPVVEYKVTNHLMVVQGIYIYQSPRRRSSIYLGHDHFQHSALPSTCFRSVFICRALEKQEPNPQSHMPVIPFAKSQPATLSVCPYARISN